MKQIYKLAQRAFEKRSEAAHGSLDKVYHMGHTDGYLDGFREAREMAVEEVKMDQAIIRAIQAWTEDETAMALFDHGTHARIKSMQNIGESEETPCGAV